MYRKGIGEGKGGKGESKQMKKEKKKKTEQGKKRKMVVGYFSSGRGGGDWVWFVWLLVL